MVDYKKRISINSEIRFGRPCIKNTRIAVYDVLNWLAEGMTHSEILEDFPELKDEDIFACLAYAADKDAKVLRAS
jgi:uncharacterized protein (DUF433 family)